MLVHLHTSSIITKLFLVELLSIFATSCISTIKVEAHKNKLSLAQTRQKILSVRGITAFLAGTKLQI